MLSHTSKIRVALLAAAMGWGVAAAAQVAVPSVPPEDMPADGGPRGTSGAAQFDDAGRAAIDPAIPSISVGVNGLTAGYAEVTSLDNGKTVLALVAHRGAAPGRLATLSPALANMLGITADGAAVRVRSVEPPPQDRGALRAGQPASPRLDTPLALLAPLRRRVEGENPAIAAGTPPPRAVAGPAPVASPPPRVATPVPPKNPEMRAETHPGASYARPGATPASPPTSAPPASPPPPPAPIRSAKASAANGYFVQVAALSNQARAQDLAHTLGGEALQAGKIWRVRIGPFADAAAAQRARDGAAKRGYAGAQIVHP